MQACYETFSANLKKSMRTINENALSRLISQESKARDISNRPVDSTLGPLDKKKQLKSFCAPVNVNLIRLEKISTRKKI
jgi:hypothetical protein